MQTKQRFEVAGQSQGSQASSLSNRQALKLNSISLGLGSDTQRYCTNKTFLLDVAAYISGKELLLLFVKSPLVQWHNKSGSVGHQPWALPEAGRGRRGPGCCTVAREHLTLPPLVPCTFHTATAAATCSTGCGTRKSSSCRVGRSEVYYQGKMLPHCITSLFYCKILVFKLLLHVHFHLNPDSSSLPCYTCRPLILSHAPLPPRAQSYPVTQKL